MVMTVCGVDCSTCEIYGKECKGCDEIKGCVFWTSMIDTKVCPIYNCVVNEKKYKNCGECSSLPCDMYKSLKDPSLSDEEHKLGIEKRVANLRK